ncbi:MAG: nucleoside diphosphate kinase regulator [Deltaproteobacteria bacterium]|nr:nucleoside diphosphate kinase regulator [Deltaproteobacteria bacterium]
MTLLAEEMPEILLSDIDKERLEALILQSRKGPARNFLEDELDRAEVIPHHLLPKDVVVMNSRAEFLDLETGERRALTLVYPGEADLKAGKVSVLAPMGIALLGLSAGQRISWRMPDGRVRRFKIISVAQQARPSRPLGRSPPGP